MTGGRSTPPDDTDTDTACIVQADPGTGITNQPSAQTEMQGRLKEGIWPPVRGANGIGLNEARAHGTMKAKEQ